MHWVTGWIEMWHGLGVGLRFDDYPWEEGVAESFEVNESLSSDEQWLSLKKELKLRKLDIFLEHWSPADEPERVEVSRRRSTIRVIAYRDIARMRAPGDPGEVARREVHGALAEVRQALLG